MKDKSITLYHGSKSGINGRIAPVSRACCDFGQGFYMGTDHTQPLTLICNYEKARMYTLQVNLLDLNILNLELGLDWALFIAYNRHKMESAKDSPIYKRIENMAEGYDMVTGYIANDRMFVVLDRFFHGDITDSALIHSLSAIKLGKQYVALTQKACDQVKIFAEHEILEEDREVLKRKSEEERRKGIAMADEICCKYRREGRFFDEIIQAGG